MESLNYKYFVAMALLVATSSVLAMESLDEQLFDAVKRRNEKEVENLIINAAADVNITDQKGNTPLHFAAARGDRYTAKVLIKAGAKIDAKEIRGYTPLHVAAKMGKLGTASLLLDAKANINARTDDKDTPLHMAAAYSRINVIRLLLDKGANKNIKNTSGQTPFQEAPKVYATKMAFITYTSPQEVSRILASVAPGQWSAEAIRSIRERAIRDLINEKLAKAKQALPRYSEDKLRQEIAISVRETLKKQSAL